MNYERLRKEIELAILGWIDLDQYKEFMLDDIIKAIKKEAEAE